MDSRNRFPAGGNGFLYSDPDLFARRGQSLKVTNNSRDYKTGDLVTWKLDNNLPHIGVVVDRRSKDGKRPLLVHNIGLGPQLEDMLFDFKITGHYRYTGGWSSRQKSHRE